LWQGHTHAAVQHADSARQCHSNEWQQYNYQQQQQQYKYYQQ
jgi:hypothetical protein